MFKQFAIVIGGLLGLAFLVSFVLPGNWEVSREMQMNVDSYDVHATVDDMETWTNWSPWGRAVDGSATITIGETRRGKDASFTWKGQELGSGDVIVRSSDPERGLVFDVGLRGGKERVRGMVTYEMAPNGGTVVRFTLSGNVSSDPIGRYRALMRGYTTGPDLVDSLARLKRQLERGV